MKKKDKAPNPEMVLVQKGSVEALAENIAKIADSVQNMNKHLTRRALVVLLNDATGGERGVSYANINKVLDGLQSLKDYIKK